MAHYYRFLSSAEVEFYGLHKQAKYITTRPIRFHVGLKVLTVPKGFVAHGSHVTEHDFCLKPSWIGHEFLYCTHRTDKTLCTRDEADLFMFNSYTDMLALNGDELYIGDIRISGEDMWKDYYERGYIVVPEIVNTDKCIELRRERNTTGSVLYGLHPMVAVGIIGVAVLLGQGITLTLAYYSG